MVIDIVINQNNIDAFSKLIPFEYQKDILDGTLAGFGYYDDSGAVCDEKIVGVIIVRRLGLWIEIEWLALADIYNSSTYSQEMISVLAFRLSTSPVNYVGIYTKLYPEEADTYNLLLESGFEFGKGTDGIYEFTIDMVDRSRLAGAERLLSSCKCIKEVDENMLAVVEHRLREDMRPLPISFPIRFEDYNRDMSILYHDEEASGIILSTVRDENVIIEIMVSQSSKCAAGMLALLIFNYDTIFYKKPKISVPVISEDAELMLKKMVPGARQKEINVGYYRI